MRLFDFWRKADAHAASRASSASNEAKPPTGSPSLPFVIATLCVATWIVCFATGAVVSSKPYRDYINRAANLEALAAQRRVASGQLRPAAARDADGMQQADSRIGGSGAESPSVPVSVVTAESLRSMIDEAVKRKSEEAAKPQTTGEYVQAGLDDLFSLTGMLALIMVLITFTPPNLALLGALAAVSGAAGRWMMDGVSRAEQAADGSRDAVARASTLKQWASTMMLSALSRGFFVYLAMLSGLLVLTGDPFDQPNAAQYVRLAGTCSLFCFIVGWQPDLLSSIISRLIMKAMPDHAANTATREHRATMVTATTVSETETVIKEPKPTANGTTTASAHRADKLQDGTPDPSVGRAA